MMLITWSASWCERSRPTQRKRPGDFCTMTAWSNKGDRLRPSYLCKSVAKDRLHPRSTVTKQRERKERAQKGVECYLWYSNPPPPSPPPPFCESCMDTVSGTEEQSSRPSYLFHAVDAMLFSGYTLGWPETLQSNWMHIPKLEQCIFWCFVQIYLLKCSHTQ